MTGRAMTALIFAIAVLMGLAMSALRPPDIAWAQSAVQSYGSVVAACGTAPGTYTPGQNRPMLIDQNGNACSSASFSGSLTATSAADVFTSPPTISGTGQPINQSTRGGLYTQPIFGATPVSLTAGFPVQPQTGSNPFPISGSISNTAFGITQTTPGVTNGVTISPTAASAAAITPIVSAAAESGHVLKASPGNLYSLYVTVPAGTSNYVMTFNSTTVPGDGPVTPIECVFVGGPTAQPDTVSISFGSGPMDAYSTGISVAFSSTGCFTKTAVTGAFFKARVL